MIKVYLFIALAFTIAGGVWGYGRKQYHNGYQAAVADNKRVTAKINDKNRNESAKMYEADRQQLARVQELESRLAELNVTGCKVLPAKIRNQLSAIGRR